MGYRHRSYLYSTDASTLIALYTSDMYVHGAYPVGGIHRWKELGHCNIQKQTK
jgi:hypothetical protein